MTRRASSSISLQKCSKPSYGASKKDKVLSLAAKYLDDLYQDLVLKITNQELESGLTLTFADAMQSENFCISASAKPNVINAFAQPNQRRIVLEAGLLLAAKNDAEVVAVLSHELAHVLMSHNGKLPKEAAQIILNNENSLQPAVQICKADLRVYDGLTHAYDTLSKDQVSVVKYAKAIAQLLLRRFMTLTNKSFVEDFSQCRMQVAMLPLITSINKAIEKSGKKNKDWAKFYARVQKKTMSPELRKAINTVTKTTEQIEDFLGYGKNSLVNWQEQEADEVGFELYLRAGYKPDSYPWLHKMILSKNATNIETCLNKINQNIRPNREFATHPSSCFRLYDAIKSEPHTHRHDYHQWLKNNNMTTLLPGRLAALKEALSKL